MDGELDKFRLTSFQSAISTLYCTVCERMWATRYEAPTCTCDMWLDGHDMALFANLYDYMILSSFYDGWLPGFWVEQQMPFFAYLMEVCPAWIDFP